MQTVKGMKEINKDTRERQRKELGHAGMELFFSSSVCCSLVLPWRVCYGHYGKVVREGKS